MPVMDGWEATKTIRRIEQERRATTAKDKEEGRTDKEKHKEGEAEEGYQEKSAAEKGAEWTSAEPIAAEGGIPIIALTGDDNRDQCFSVGMNDYLAKPVQKDAFYSVLQRVLDRKMAASLPAGPPSPTTLIASSPPLRQEAQKTILLVEDNAVNARIGSHVLRKHNFAVDVAQNGKIAFDMFCSTPDLYALVLMVCCCPSLWFSENQVSLLIPNFLYLTAGSAYACDEWCNLHETHS